MQGLTNLPFSFRSVVEPTWTGCVPGRVFVHCSDAFTILSISFKVKLHCRQYYCRRGRVLSACDIPDKKTFMKTDTACIPINKSRHNHHKYSIYSLNKTQSIQSPSPEPEQTPTSYKLIPSISLMTTAICARYAASATRLKSCRNGAVAVGPPMPCI